VFTSTLREALLRPYRAADRGVPGVLEGPLPRIRDLRLWVGGIDGGSLAL
jgi:hypothetical protein